MSRSLEFYFDFLSPYSYLSWCWLREKGEFLKSKDIELVFRPVILSQIIGYYETKGPAEIKEKRDYLFKDCLRKSIKREVPFTLPKSLPFNSLYILRMCLALDYEKRFSFVDMIFRAGWEKGLEIGEEDSLKRLLDDNGYDSEFLLSKVSDREIRKELKSNVKLALSKGVFGLPSFIFQEELFWGDDSKEDLFSFIEGKDKFNEELYNYFQENFPVSSN